MVRKLFLGCMLMLFCMPLSVLAETLNTAVVFEANQTLLPENFLVYTNGTDVINHSLKGFAEKTLPTNNDYKDKPGCYIACYSHNKATSVYGVGKDIYVQGQVRVPGQYSERICIPNGYERKDISKETAFNRLCSAKIRACSGIQCWAGGDTGGWFGIEQ